MQSAKEHAHLCKTASWLIESCSYAKNYLRSSEQDQFSLWPAWDAERSSMVTCCWICSHMTLTNTMRNVKFECASADTSGSSNLSNSCLVVLVNRTPDNAAYRDIFWQHPPYAHYSSSIVKLLCGRRTLRSHTQHAYGLSRTC